ncbi:MAG: phosphopantetheine-binding protein [Desulfotomaculum sp.]|nr:phosphopantetheine-binding protein [Desulfotomaculum sp.]MCL0081158.1 phosphopantetheine-binding protein [Peptococcaceae bacterium]
MVELNKTSANIEQLQKRVRERQELCQQLKSMLVERLDLPVDAAWIDDDQPLIGRGLELDSVDALELVVGVEAQFEVAITDERMDAFGSVNRLADFIEEQRSQETKI